MASLALHPIVLVSYFSSILAITMLVMHPVYIGISVVMSFFLVMKFTPLSRKGLSFLIVLCSSMMLINPLISQQGQQIVFQLGSRIITVEAIVYGAVLGGLLLAVLLWFQLFNMLVPAEKLLFVGQKIAPQFALLVVITMRLVTTFTQQITRITTAQKALGHSVTDGPIKERFHVMQRILSILVTWALENAIETADSMKARGYGTRARTTFSIYRWERRDSLFMTVLLILDAGIVLAVIQAQTAFSYYPLQPMPTEGFMGFGSFFLLCSLFVLIELWEWMKWRF